MVNFLILLFVCFHLQNGLTSFSTSIDHQLEYGVDYSDGHLSIIARWKAGSCQVKSCVIPNLVKIGVQPFVQLSTCSGRKADSASSSLSIGHILLTAARENQSTCLNGTTGCSTVWSADVPVYLSSGYCIELWVKSSALWSGVQIEGTKMKIWTSELVTSTDEDNDGAYEGYEVVDVTTYDGTRAALLRNIANSSFVLHHSKYPQAGEESVVVTLPRCVSYQEGHNAVWVMFTGSSVNESCDDEGSHLYTPTRVFAVSKMELYIIGDGLLFSPNRGVTVYSLRSPQRVIEITSFAVSSDGGVYALIWKTENETSNSTNDIDDGEKEVWLGFVGKQDFYQLYPSSLCDIWWQSMGVELEDPTLANTLLQFDYDNNLYMVTGNFSIKLPPSLLVTSEEYKRRLEGQSPLCISPRPPMETNQYHTLYQLGLQFHPLVYCPSTYACPISYKTVQAPSCERITRNKFHMSRGEGVLRRLDQTVMAELNCSIPGNGLPGDIFLDKLEQYSFIMEFFLDPEILDLPSLSLAVKVAVPEALSVRVDNYSYHGATHSFIFQVSLQETQGYVGQLDSGVVATSVDVSLHLVGVGAECLDPLSTSIQPPGHTHTRVHIGCPPGLSIVFDANSTRSIYNQFCTHTSNISCFYFGNKFYPTFLLVDLVTEERSNFTGHYTLRAIAGGNSPSDMTYFSTADNVESGIWTPVNESKDGPVPVYHHDDNGLTWVCSTTSPCGERLPGSGRSPEYYLLLEALNMLVDSDTYCALSVQFLIKIHGLSMGGITTVVSVMAFTIICTLIVLLMFVSWHCRLKFIYCKDVLMDKWNGCWPDNRDKLLVFIRKHRGKINPTT